VPAISASFPSKTGFPLKSNVALCLQKHIIYKAGLHVSRNGEMNVILVLLLRMRSEFRLYFFIIINLTKLAVFTLKNTNQAFVKAQKNYLILIKNSLYYFQVSKGPVTIWLWLAYNIPHVIMHKRCCMMCCFANTQYFY